jgi:hypothetical protein
MVAGAVSLAPARPPGRECLDRLVDRPAESAVRGDGTSEEEVEAVSRHNSPAALQAKVGRDADDADVAGVAARDELHEHPDLARGAVVDRGAIEPRDEGVRRAKALGVGAVDLVRRERRRLLELLSRRLSG